MSDIDFDRLQPLRLAGGSHTEGSGYGCAMNVVSYITGDTEITDLPGCSHFRLAVMVQRINDHLAVRRGTMVGHTDCGMPIHTLSPEDAVTMIRLGCLTIGTTMLEVDEYLRPEGYWLVTPPIWIDELIAYGYIDQAAILLEEILIQIRKDHGLDDIAVPEVVAEKVNV